MSCSQEQALETYAEHLSCEGSWNRILLEPSHVLMEKPQNPSATGLNTKQRPLFLFSEASRFFLLTPPSIHLLKRGLVSFSRTTYARMCTLITFNFK